MKRYRRRKLKMTRRANDVSHFADVEGKIVQHNQEQWRWARATLNIKLSSHRHHIMKSIPQFISCLLRAEHLKVSSLYFLIPIKSHFVESFVGSSASEAIHILTYDNGYAKLYNFFLCFFLALLSVGWRGKFTRWKVKSSRELYKKS